MNNGFIVGAGGAGGSGPDGVGPSPGSPGGPALRAQAAISVTNNGTIGGGVVAVVAVARKHTVASLTKVAAVVVAGAA